MGDGSLPGGARPGHALTGTTSASSSRLARNSLSVAKWTLVSRITGFARIVMVAGVLGPTYLGNTFQATNTLPNVAFELLTGSLIASLLVPALVRHVDARRSDEVERVAGGFLGVALAGFIAVAVLGILGGPLILTVLSSTVSNPELAEAQRDVGFLLLALLMPQVVLYGIAGICGAVMNAHGRFALSAAAPSLENLGVMATMALFFTLYGTGGSIESIGSAPLLLLGVGTTGAVALHAAVQWWGARRLGVRLVPRAGWRDPEVRAVLRRTRPSVGYAALNATRVFAFMVAANSLAGGVVAFSLALQFLHLPTALGARPVALALLPDLARLYQSRTLDRFRDEFVRSVGLITFLAVPATVVYAALAVPLAEAASFGELATERGIALLAASVGGVALGVLGESVFVMATHAAYALDDPRSPFIAMVLRTILSLAGMGIALTLSGGTATLLALGLAISAGNLVSAGWLVRRLTRVLPTGSERLVPPLARATTASAVMVLPAYIVANGVPGDGGDAASVLAIALAGLVGSVTFIAVQRTLRSPELAFFARALGSRRKVEAP